MQETKCPFSENVPPKKHPCTQCLRIGLSLFLLLNDNIGSSLCCNLIGKNPNLTTFHAIDLYFLFLYQPLFVSKYCLSAYELRGYQLTNSNLKLMQIKLFCSLFPGQTIILSFAERIFVCLSFPYVFHFLCFSETIHEQENKPPELCMNLIILYIIAMFSVFTSKKVFYKRKKQLLRRVL